MTRPGFDEMAFGAFRLSERERTLRRSDSIVPLPSRAFDVLLTLIESGSDVVSKDELMRRVWGNIVVQENNLHVQIAAIRRALGAQGREIQTVPGRGYRFIGDVSSAALCERRTRQTPPADLTTLIGRDVEMACVLRRCEESRLVSVVGPPGVGKSRLAREAAARLQAVQGLDCCWVEFPGRSGPGTAAAALIDALGLELSAPTSLIPNVVENLRGRQALIVFDGCEQILSQVRSLTQLLLAELPEVRILCASEIPLGIDGEHVVRIAPFEVPSLGPRTSAQALRALPAIRLFAERARAADGLFALTDASLPLVLQVCRDLDGLPLAIELAARWSPLIGIQPLAAASAEEQLALLEQEDVQVGVATRSLRAHAHRSIGLLPDLERRALGQLAALEGSFSLRDTQDVRAALTAPEMVRAVAALANRSLLLLSPDLDRPCYRMLGFVRRVALEQARLAGVQSWSGGRFADPEAHSPPSGLRH